MTKTDVLSIGGATLDLMIYTKECEILDNPKDLTKQKLIAFEYGAKINSERVYLTYGGGAANSAYNFANLGLRTAIRCQIGADLLGADIKNYLVKNKINTRLITSQPGGHTGLSVVVNTGHHNEHVAFLYRGANHLLEVKPAGLKKIRPDWIYLTSLTGPKTKQNLENIFRTAVVEKIKISWNPGNEQLALGWRGLRRYLKQVQVFNVNKDEAIELALSANQKKTNINQLLQILKSWGPEIVVITAGPKGAYVFDGKKKYYRPALPIKGINTTGAGDSFGSTFVSGLIKTGQIDYSLAAAIINSNYVIQEIGAQAGLQSWPNIKKLIRRYKL